MNKNAARRAEIVAAFAHEFASEPTVWVRAPGRVDLMGSHTDYNLGYVLTLPIDRDTWIAARPRADRRVRLHSLNTGTGADFALDDDEHDAVATWTNYVRGVVLTLRAEGLSLTGFDAVVHSTVPLSSGLSSSAALEAATAMLLSTLGGWEIDRVRMAVLCQRAENRFVGVNCGILDQYSSILGRSGCALLLDCRDLSNRQVVVPNEIQVVICDTRAKRELTGSPYAERRASCEFGARLLGASALRDVTSADLAARAFELPAEVERRCRFIVEEDERVLALERALPLGDRAAIRDATLASFAGARDLYEISCPEMAAMQRAMLAAPGCIGARQAGAGFGGCMVAFVEAEEVAEFAASVRETFAAATGIAPEVYPVRAAAGASLAG